MKKFLTSLCLLAVFSSPLFAENPAFQDKELIIIDIRDAKEEDLANLMSPEVPNLVIAFEANTKLPMEFYCKGDLLNLTSPKEAIAEVEVMRTFYVRSIDGSLLLSSDLKEWKDFFEFVSGNVSASIASKDDQALIKFGSETTLKENASLQ